MPRHKTRFPGLVVKAGGMLPGYASTLATASHPWEEERTTSGSLLVTRQVDAHIIRQMPPETTTFAERGMFDLIGRTVRRIVLRPNERIGAK